MIKREDGSIAVVAQDDHSQGNNNSLQGGSQDNGGRGTQNGDAQGSTG